ncbi:ABC-F family ATP-binding cassette domain-containing protein [Glutamicibacter protophormiae]|uniref:ABC-F family ATP-binding cassette domain-containing protein n=1 Tax=Glutamicibacter protophormiae TaxID=37930 RepID=UPI002A80E766|nr:ABC-F family ATP-binding cassette domain-containing protein [Glutamicibacter protophormiae]WPR66027.1 ABC-F family ATP-binding cassette domain-containing protein [Glutamicibacter protophormiae]WPR69524.1 ABC-F family ATP-binding cassette domain-containing protein [Glutamicibacter protophormiae]
MTATLVAKDLTGGHAHRTLFSHLDFTAAPGDVYGVVGVNGAGKSTLLRLLAGVDEPQGGSVSTAPDGAFIGWLPQEHERFAGEDMADAVPGADDAYAAAFETWMASGAMDLEDRIPETLAELGFTLPLDTGTAALSGGQMARVALAALLLSRFDVVLLDEPTNDLDLEGLERLEQFIMALRAPVMLVSHDREFLARCTTGIIELDLAQQQVAVYEGGYDAYLDERAVSRRHAREAYDEFAGKKADLVSRARTQREWSSQGVRNAMRKAPDNDKIRRRANSESSEKQAAKVRQMESRIKRLDEVAEPRKEWVLQFSIADAPRGSSVLCTLNQAQLALGGFAFGPVSVQVNAGDRIGITGPNGAGKSTLLNLLLGRLTPDAGTSALGASVMIGEIDQARSQLPAALPLGEAFEAAVPEYSAAEARTLLAKFGLKAEQTASPVGKLSPGERTRASMALLQARGVNLLVLDEPTNHLDLPAIEQLEEALEAYQGALLLVTHDRRMLQNVRLDARWQVQDGKLAAGI